MPDESPTCETSPTPHQPWWKGARGEWYVIVQVVLFALIAFGPRYLPGAPEWPAPWFTVATVLGLALMIAGASLALAGVFRLGPNLTPLPYPRECSTLVRTGPYAVVRHPIYSGLILGGFGWGLYLHAPLTLLWALGLFVLFDIKSRKEEGWLTERFPEYAEYRTHVKKLIPFVY